MKRKHLRLYVMGGLLVLDLLFFGYANPASAPSLLLVCAFGLLAATLAGFWYGVFWTVRAVTGKTQQGSRRYILGATALSTLIVALDSIGQLTIRDVIALIALAAIFWFYASYYRAKQT